MPVATPNARLTTFVATDPDHAGMDFKEMKLADATDGLGMRKATARLVKLTSREKTR